MGHELKKFPHKIKEKARVIEENAPVLQKIPTNLPYGTRVKKWRVSWKTLTRAIRKARVISYFAQKMGNGTITLRVITQEKI